MLATEFEEEIQDLTDTELLRCAVKYFKLAVLEFEHANGVDDAQEYLDYIFMECSHRGKEWIYDKAEKVSHKRANAVEVAV